MEEVGEEEEEEVEGKLEETSEEMIKWKKARIFGASE